MNRPPPPLFDARQVRRAFSRAARSYDDAAALQREVESRLLESLDYFEGGTGDDSPANPKAGRPPPAVVVDLGTGTGSTARALHRALARRSDPDALRLVWLYGDDVVPEELHPGSTLLPRQAPDADLRASLLGAQPETLPAIPDAPTIDDIFPAADFDAEATAAPAPESLQKAIADAEAASRTPASRWANGWPSTAW